MAALTDPPDAAAPRSLLAAWRRRRDALIASPRFQRWADRFPLTRPLARREARALFDLTAGFVYSQTLAACVELELFERLRDGPKPLSVVASQAGLPPEAMARLCRAAAALRLLELRGEAVSLGPLGAAALGAPGVREMVRHHRLFYADLADPLALLRGERAPELARYWSYVRGGAPSAEEAARYSRLMAASQAMVAEEVLRAGVLRGVRRLMDVGGGDGTFLETAARRLPRLRGTLVDLPPVAAQAEARFARAGLGARLEARGGDMLAAPLPQGADAASLVRVLYDHDAPAARVILARVFAALPPGGRVIVAEPMAGGPRPDRVGDAYFGFYTLAMTSGAPREPAEHGRLLAEAGFDSVRLARRARSFAATVMTARKPR
ncbi:methyltransferase [Albimonas sp. CAU 1670]|uniref:methyltransferase n=1 Tax=Albimonas sp. CAU 1670 TaxID=3032599 RepID=UPI0023DC5F8F|nr:methyltransferase [Albimonas sp. CAU 1670]MDF2231488.1 methyltransferase [Albimonas sp. CAU 1670]